jgi:hypothetical protein
MDPNANLLEQERILVARRDNGDMRDRYRLRDLRVALCEWLNSEGFAPDWERCPLATAWLRRTYPGYFA